MWLLLLHAARSVFLGPRMDQVVSDFCSFVVIFLSLITASRLLFWTSRFRLSDLMKFTCLMFFFQALNFLVESFGLLNDLFPFSSILDAGYAVCLSSFGRCPV
jgi:hypothetical protein